MDRERKRIIRAQRPTTGTLSLLSSSFLLLLLVACADTPNGNPEIANPASVYCEERGGTLEIVTGDEGQIGICTIDGVRCEEWAYYRGECPEPCGECPQIMPPSPDFCKDGKIVQSTPDRCGCYGPPGCVTDAR